MSDTGARVDTSNVACRPAVAGRNSLVPAAGSALVVIENRYSEPQSSELPAGAVVVKVAKLGHDMRFDIPVIGMQTFRILRKAKISCLAVEAGRTILLEREKLIAEADRLNIAFTGFDVARLAGESAEQRDNENNR